MKDPSVVSLFVLAGLAAVQLIIVAIRGVPELPGFYTEPYEWGKTIEIFVARSYLFGYVYGLYSSLGNLMALALLCGMLGVAAWLTPRYLRFALATAAVAVLVADLALLLNRPGISRLFSRYTTSGPDHYFFAQTAIAYLIGACIIAGAEGGSSAWGGIDIVTFCFAPDPKSRFIGMNAFMADTQSLPPRLRSHASLGLRT
jgi:hypothetical protein